MIHPLGRNNSGGADSEYMRIMLDLRYFGLSPTGNKYEDAQKLAQIKSELIDKIQKKNNNTSDSSDGLGIQVINPVDESGSVQRSEMEEQRLGAMNIARLNKIYFGL